MHSFNVGSMLLTAAMAIASVKASPSFNGLLARDLTGSACKDFIYGAQKVKIGEVCVSISGDSLIVQYPTLSAGQSYTDLHVIVQTSEIKESVQGQWPYNKERKCSLATASCTIPIEPTWRICNLPLFIGTHASFSVPGGSETGWGRGTCIRDRPNCPQYFQFTTECKCPVLTTYAPHTTSLVYKTTIVEERTVYCSTTPAAVATSTACNNPNAATTQTVEGVTKITDFACASPVHEEL